MGSGRPDPVVGESGGDGIRVPARLGKGRGAASPSRGGACWGKTGGEAI